MAASDRPHRGPIAAGTIAILCNLALLSLIPRQPVALPVNAMQLVFVMPAEEPRGRPLDGASDAAEHPPEQPAMRSANNREPKKQPHASVQANVSAAEPKGTATSMGLTQDLASLTANTGSTPASRTEIGGAYQGDDPLHLKRNRAIAPTRETVHLRLRPVMSLSLLGQRKYCTYLRGLLLGTDSDREQAFSGPTTKEGVFTAMQNSGCIKN